MGSLNVSVTSPSTGCLPMLDSSVLRLEPYLLYSIKGPLCVGLWDPPKQINFMRKITRREEESRKSGFKNVKVKLADSNLNFLSSFLNSKVEVSMHTSIIVPQHCSAHILKRFTSGIHDWEKTNNSRAIDSFYMAVFLNNLLGSETHFSITLTQCLVVS